MPVSSEENQLMSNPNMTVRISPKKLEQLKKRTGLSKKATAVSAAVDHILDCGMPVLPMLPMDGHFLTISEVQKHMQMKGLKYSESQIRRFCRSGKLRAHKPKGVRSHWRILSISLEEFVQSLVYRPKVKHLP